MNNKSVFWAGVAVMAGLVFFGAMIPTAVKVWRSTDRTVAVKGLCEREVPADKVIWPITIKVVGNDLADTYAELDRKNDIIAGFLADGGIAADNITLAIPVVSDKYAQEYGNNDRTYRYLITSTTTVCSKDVDKVLLLMDKMSTLGSKGIAPEQSWEYQTQFIFEGLNDLKPEMIQEATQNAREVAQKFATDSHSVLGKIKSASQGTFTIDNRDSNTPQVKKVRVVTSVVYNLVK